MALKKTVSCQIDDAIRAQAADPRDRARHDQVRQQFVVVPIRMTGRINVHRVVLCESASGIR